MRALLIDPAAETVTEIEVANSLQGIRGALEVDLVDAVDLSFAPGHAMYVDDEGLTKPGTRAFEIGNPQPYAGRGLVVGFDAETGEERDATVSLGDVRARVAFGLVVDPEWAGEDGADPSP